MSNRILLRRFALILLLVGAIDCGLVAVLPHPLFYVAFMPMLLSLLVFAFIQWPAIRQSADKPSDQ